MIVAQIGDVWIESRVKGIARGDFKTKGITMGSNGGCDLEVS